MPTAMTVIAIIVHGKADLRPGGAHRGELCRSARACRRTVPLVGVPNALALQIPSIAPYSYATVGNRVYLVDPATSVIVADVTE